MKNIRITVNAPVLPTGSPYVHTGTSYQVSKSLDFATPANLLVDVLNDLVNLREYRTELDILNDTVVYIRTKYHFGSKESDWSRIVSSMGDQAGIQFSNIIVSTPTISIDKNTLSTGETIIVINTTPFTMLAGSGSHKSSSWTISDTDGNVIFERLEDEDNLCKLVFNTKALQKDKIYEVKVKHHTSTNVASYNARTLYTNHHNETKLYEMTQVGELVRKRDLYFKLISFTSMYISVDLTLQDMNGVVLVEQKDQPTLTPSINPGDLSLFETYEIYARIKIGKDTYTPNKLVYRGLAFENYLVVPDPYISYLSKYDFAQMMLFNGLTVQNSHEFYQGSILLAKNSDRNIYRYKIKDGKLTEIGKCISLPLGELVGVPHINMLPLYSGDLLVNYYDDSDPSVAPHSVFKKYKHNIITNKFSELKTLDCPNENLSTAITASAGVLRDNSVWYIPAGETNSNGETNTLSLYRIDPETFISSKVRDLPFNAIKNVSLCVTSDDKIIILGGSYVDGFVLSPTGNMVWTRTNHAIYKYDPVIDLFSVIGNLNTLDIGLSVLQTYLRRDGKIVIFNACDEGLKLGDQQSYLLDVTTGDVTAENNDTPDNLIYQSTIVLRNGDILRFSNNEEDPQVVHRYVSNTMLESELDENTYITDVNSDLVVGLNKTVTIFDPYKYKSITILGNNPDDTGTLIWNDKGVLRYFTYEDLIVYTSTDVDMAVYDERKYRSILILDGRTLTLSFESIPIVQ